MTLLGILLETAAPDSILPSDPNQNMAVSLALAGLAFVVTLIIGRPIVTFLRLRKAGKQVRIDGPQTHIVKTGTPTMGGLMVSVSVVVITLVFNIQGRLSMLLPVGVLIAVAVLGAIDDRMSLLGGSKQGGMSARPRLEVIQGGRCDWRRSSSKLAAERSRPVSRSMQTGRLDEHVLNLLLKPIPQIGRRWFNGQELISQQVSLGRHERAPCGRRSDS